MDFCLREYQTAFDWGGGGACVRDDVCVLVCLLCSCAHTYQLSFCVCLGATPFAF